MMIVKPRAGQDVLVLGGVADGVGTPRPQPRTFSKLVCLM